jgi:hypothetical protein
MLRLHATEQEGNLTRSFDAPRAVYALFQGGLGNQLFQYAAARHLALANRAELKLDLRAYGPRTLRRFELGAFRIAGTRVGALERLRFRTKLWRGADAKYLREPHFHYWPSLLQFRSAFILMDGYWQSEKYFSDVEEIIRSEIVLREPLRVEARRLADSIETTQAVAIHVRRGDYVSDPVVRRVHPVQPVSYYRSAVDFLLRRGVSNPWFYLFSDDPDWCRANIEIPAHPVTYVADYQVGSSVAELELMRRCRHHVIANSSFSWWGAWLAEHREQIVVAPRQWFSTGARDTRDLYPAGWTLI